MLNKFRVGSNDDVKRLLKTGFIQEFNEPGIKKNDAILKYFPDELYTVGTHGKITGNCTYW